jgi:hypothetical protein
MTTKRGAGRPAKYVTSDGKRVPGVTTITSRYKESGGLIHWAWQCGVDGVDYRQKRDDAGDVGHVAHALIEADIHGESFEMPPQTTAEHRAMALAALDAFRAWKTATKVEIIETELPLVSDEYRFGGTLDAVGRIVGELVLLDWKSGNKVYPEMLVQVAAYRQLWEEHYPQPITGLHLLRVGKEHGDFHHHSWPLAVLDAGWEAFKLMRALYDLDATLKKAVG